MNNETYKKYITEEYYKAKAHYEAMKDLGVKYGVITTVSESSSGASQVSNTEKPVVDTKPNTEPAKPVSTEPEIVVSGNTEYAMKSGEKTNCIVYINNVTSSSDYVISPYGSPIPVSFDISGVKIDNGFKITIGAKASLTHGKAYVTIRLKKDPTTTKTITFTVN